MKAKGMKVCIPPRKTENEIISFSKTWYNRRHPIGNTFSKLKDWRCIATRYDRCAYTFFQPSSSLSLESSILINES